MQLHTAHRNVKGDILEVGDVLGLQSEKWDIEMTFENFIEKLNGCTQRKLRFWNMCCIW